MTDTSTDRTNTSSPGTSDAADVRPAGPTGTGFLRGSPERIADALEELAAISEPGDGVTRLAYSPLERRAHEVFGRWMDALGCEVTTDPAGNTIATRPGADPDAPALGTGSHLDSVYGGGRYDGIVGVVAAVELARQLAAHRVRTRHPLRFVAFAGEEGARFGQACLGSQLAAGLTSVDEVASRLDRDGVSLPAAMREVGLDPTVAATRGWQPREWAAFVELHIEQGSVLEQDGVPIGVVDLISGSTRLELSLTGQPSHTGGTPMRGRSDALVAAAEAVLIVEGLALDPRHHGTRATVGRLDVTPGSITTIPGTATLSLDVRDVDADRQRDTAAEIVRRVSAVCDRRRVRLDARRLGDTSPVVLPIWIRQALTDAANRVGVGYRVLTSGASHDSQMINHIVPSGMVFVPSRHGLSHVPEEWTSASDIALGVEVLGGAMLGLDETLDERAGAHSTYNTHLEA